MIDFKGHRVEKDIILLCVRWYLAYPLSYRNLEEMMEERGIQVDHSNIYRWVQKFTPPLEAAFRNGKKRPGAAVGGWTRLTSRARDSGNTCTVPSTRKAKPLT